MTAFLYRIWQRLTESELERAAREESEYLAGASSLAELEWRQRELMKPGARHSAFYHH